MKYPIQDVSDADIAFPANVKKLMPPYNPELFEYKLPKKWRQLFTDWFYHGLEDLKFTPKEGVNEKLAIRHLKCIVGSFEPKHEHKVQAFVLLAEDWFDDVTYSLVKK